MEARDRAEGVHVIEACVFRVQVKILYIIQELPKFRVLS